MKKHLLMFTLVSIGVAACKKAGSNARLREDTPTVPVSANFKVVNSHVMIALNSTSSQGQSNTAKSSLSNIKVSYVRSDNNNVDLTKLVAQNGQLPLSFVPKLNITATITNDKVTNATCEVKNIQVSATPVTANFNCADGNGGGGGGSSNNGKYPPDVKDTETQKNYDTLTAECQKISGSQLVVDAANKNVVYGCYCSKIDRQLIFATYKTIETISTFKSDCSGTVKTTGTALTQELNANCPTNKNEPPGPNKPQTNVNGTCTCLSKTNSSEVVIKYSDFYAIYQPAAALKNKISQVCK